MPYRPLVRAVSMPSICRCPQVGLKSDLQHIGLHASLALPCSPACSLVGHKRSALRRMPIPSPTCGAMRHARLPPTESHASQNPGGLHYHEPSLLRCAASRGRDVRVAFSGTPFLARRACRCACVRLSFSFSGSSPRSRDTFFCFAKRKHPEAGCLAPHAPPDSALAGPASPAAVVAWISVRRGALRQAEGHITADTTRSK